MTRQDFLKAALVLSCIPAFANLSESASNDEAIKKLAKIIDFSDGISVSNLQIAISPSPNTKLSDLQYIYKNLNPKIKDLNIKNSIDKFTNNVKISEFVITFANKTDMKKICSELLVYMKASNVKKYIKHII